MAKVTGSNPVEPTPFDASQLSLGTHVPPACVSRRGSGPSAFPRGCGIIGCSAATHRGERLSMGAEIRDADEAPELEGVGTSRVHRRRRRIGGPRVAVLPEPTVLRVCGKLRRVRLAPDLGAPPRVSRRTRIAIRLSL